MLNKTISLSRYIVIFVLLSHVAFAEVQASLKSAFSAVPEDGFIVFSGQAENLADRSASIKVVVGYSRNDTDPFFEEHKWLEAHGSWNFSFAVPLPVAWADKAHSITIVVENTNSSQEQPAAVLSLGLADQGKPISIADITTFPRKWHHLMGYTSIEMSPRQQQMLSSAQREALQEWISTGGQLAGISALHTPIITKPMSADLDSGIEATRSTLTVLVGLYFVVLTLCGLTLLLTETSPFIIAFIVVPLAGIVTFVCGVAILGQVAGFGRSGSMVEVWHLDTPGTALVDRRSTINTGLTLDLYVTSLADAYLYGSKSALSDPLFKGQYPHLIRSTELGSAQLREFFSVTESFAVVNDHGAVQSTFPTPLKDVIWQSDRCHYLASMEPQKNYKVGKRCPPEILYHYFGDRQPAEGQFVATTTSGGMREIKGISWKSATRILVTHFHQEHVI